MEVGVRELKNNLSRYLARVSQGSEVIVTDRGRAIAKITPIGTKRTMDRLIAEGIVTPTGSVKGLAPAPRARAKEPASPLVDDQRR